MKPENKRVIEIEDLLRLKRIERPRAEFWPEFERQLRTKQLAALVAKRPWWDRLPSAFAGLSRYRLPLGAAAILGVSFLSFGDRLGNSDTDGIVSRDPNPVASVEQPSAASEVLAARSDPAVESASVAQGSAPTLVMPESATVAVAATEGTFTLPMADTVAKIDAGLHRFGSVETRMLGASVSSDSVPSRSLLGSSFESRITPPRQTVDPFQKITPPAERMKSKLTTALVARASLEVSSTTIERQANRISQEQLYDQINRIGARGAGVNFSF